MAELVLEFDNPGGAPSVNDLDRMGWALRRKALQPWRDATIRALQHAGRHQAEAVAAVRNRPCTLVVDFGVARPNQVRDPMNWTRLTKAMIDEVRLQPAYAPKLTNQRRHRLRGPDGRPLWINAGWALLPDDDPRWLEELPPRFHGGQTTLVVITTKETDGQNP